MGIKYRRDVINSGFSEFSPKIALLDDMEGYCNWIDVAGASGIVSFTQSKSFTKLQCLSIVTKSLSPTYGDEVCAVRSILPRLRGLYALDGVLSLLQTQNSYFFYITVHFTFDSINYFFQISYASITPAFSIYTPSGSVEISGIDVPLIRNQWYPFRLIFDTDSLMYKTFSFGHQTVDLSSYFPGTGLSQALSPFEIFLQGILGASGTTIFTLFYDNISLIRL